MARKTASRMDKRREAEAADAQGVKKKAKKKKTTRKKSTRKSAKAAVRRRMVWGVFSGSYKLEAQFPYDQRDAAEEKLEQLRNRSSKKLYFIQPIKEPITDDNSAKDAEAEKDDAEETAAAEEVNEKEVDDAEESDDDSSSDDGDEDEEE